jgi:uncharacterized protein (TIGR00730 family)
MTRVCVFAGSNAGSRPAYAAAAQDLGCALVDRGIELVYGGGKVGLMGALADAVLAGGGQVQGVIPAALVAKEVAHAKLTQLHVVGSMHQRKALMSDLSDAILALPGGYGTADEFFEMLTWAQLGIHRKPCGLLNVDGYFDGLLAFLDHSIEERFVRPENRPMVLTASSAGGLLDQFTQYVPPVVEKWLDRKAT